MERNGELTAMPMPRFVALAMGILIVLWAIGAMPTWRLSGAEGLTAMLVGGALALVASLVGTTPLLMTRGRAPVERVSAVLGSIALRLAVVMVLLIAVALGSGLDREPLFIWTALSHCGLLVADTLFARADMRASERAS